MAVLRIREMLADDSAAAAEVLQRNGLAASRPEDWAHLWDGDPFQAPDTPRGWMLEESGRGAVGTFSNLQLGYEWNGQPMRVLTGFTWAVDPDFRRHAIGMLRRWSAQPGVDVLLTNTASERVGEILSALRFRRVPHPEYDQALYWVVNSRGFAASALRQLRAPLPHLLSYPAGLVIETMRRGTGWRGSRAETGSVVSLDTFDERFDCFWMKLRRIPNRLSAVRTAAALTWHFKRACESLGIEILGLSDGDELAGYLVMVRQDYPAIGLTRYRIADLQVLDGSPVSARALMVSALRRADERGIHVVEVVGLSEAKREALAVLRPLRRKLPSWLFYYRARDPGLAAALERADAWDPSPYDGDGSL
jgi:hypothetical protein